MAEFEINGIAYKSKRMATMNEWHVTRRLAPVINGMLPKLLSAVKSSEGGPISLGAMDADETARIMGDFLTFLAEMKDADSNLVIAECCSVTQRKDGSGWADIWSRAGNRPMYDDIRVPVMAQVAFRVVQDAVVDFMPSLGLALSAEAPASASTPSASQTA